MGGSALKDCSTRRYARNEYYPLEKEVLKKLEALFKDHSFTPIVSYLGKESFGDMDVLTDSEFITEGMIIDIIDEFAPKQVFKNGNCLSFEYKEFQIDLIATGVDNYVSSQHYFAYNDLGNLCGRLAGAIGLKLGHDGLSYNHREGTNLIANITISKDWHLILPILGLDRDIFYYGFDTLEEIFEYVSSSIYFRKDIFLLENRNHTSRVRDAKRKTYMAFLEWLESGSCTAPEGAEKRSKEEWLLFHLKSIEGFRERYLQVLDEHVLNTEYKKRLNGGLVRHLTGIEGKELGAFMKFLKDYYGEQALKKDVLKMNANVVNGWIIHMHKVFTNNLDVVEWRA